MGANNLPSGANGGHELRIVRTLNVRRELAFEVWSTPAHLVNWWGPRDEAGQDFTTPFLDVDFRPGGHYRICIRAPDGREFWQRGTYQEIVEPERLVFTFSWEQDGENSPVMLVEVTFAEQGNNQTLLTFCQYGFATSDARNGHQIGWEECVDRLAIYLSLMSNTPAEPGLYKEEMHDAQVQG